MPLCNGVSLFTVSAPVTVISKTLISYVPPITPYVPSSIQARASPFKIMHLLTA
jgi:hypothetical protein